MAFFEAFGVREDPFGVTPDPRFLYLGPSHREALASLVHGVEAHRGFMALIAPPGMGKTTLLFRLLEHLRASAETVFHFQTQCTAHDLLRYLLADLGIEPIAGDIVALHQQFNQELLRRNGMGRPVVVVVDEAQNLSDDVLEAIRLLSDFETTRTKLMQIVLSGQEQLLTRLASARQMQLRQRISIIARLRPLGAEATAQFIEHRMRVAGLEGELPFTPEALQAIAKHAQGIPRSINNYCFHALSIGFGLEQSRIDAAIVEEVARDFELTSELPLEEPDILTNQLLGIPLQPAAPIHACATPPAAISAPVPAPSAATARPVPQYVVATASAPVNEPAAAAMQAAAPARNSQPKVRIRAPAAAGAAAVIVLAAAIVGWGWRPTLPGIAAGPKESSPVADAGETADPTGELKPKAASTVAVPKQKLPAGERAPLDNKPTARTVVVPESNTADVPAIERVDSDAVELPAPQAAAPPTPAGNDVEAPNVPEEVLVARNDLVPNVTSPRPAPALVLPVSGGATSPKLLHQTLPDYPASIRRQGVKGDVVLKVRITERGTVEDISIMRGNPVLAQAAVNAVRKWEFEPGTLNGKPISLETTVTLRFNH